MIRELRGRGWYVSWRVDGVEWWEFMMEGRAATVLQSICRSFRLQQRTLVNSATS